ncbi:CADD family putative folate metabolism protein [Rickettsiella endosymbiont of Dermanyssus gallinae]|uniref:CADD family putative folate metabolism protein n=1 Tax=Rickettsiella endosymbiont of Dermanyssus gallinae TaxID=2856608 RepID=UPI001C52E231|nr:CADD family putative folate metabolism protein [Rickettsiella endosymbiont of Dermanyssus gallinae]
MTKQIPDNRLNADSLDNSMQVLDRQLNENHLLKHPMYQAWSAGKLSLNDLQTYACQYYHHVDAFPRYLSATHSNCHLPHARQVLLENLNDEEGDTTTRESHPTLWLQFAKGLGLCEETVKNSVPTPETKQLIDDFLSLSRSSYAEGLGALYAYERQIPQTAASKIMGLKQFYNIDDPATLKFFLVHLEADVEHSEATKTLMQELLSLEKIKAEKAAKKIAQSVWDMLSGIQARTIGNVHCEIPAA